MAVTRFISGELDDSKRRDMIFRGEFVLFKGVPSMKLLCERADFLAREAFGAGIEPELAHHHYAREDYLAIVDPLQRRFTNDDTAKRLFRNALAECGVDLEKTFWDWFPLRIQPGSGTHTEMATAGLHGHRDSWYSNLQAQNNWWAPIYTLEPCRAVAYHPRYFDRPIANNSEGWDLGEFRKARAEVRARHGTSEEVKNAYPAIRAMEEVDGSSEIIFIMEPGDIICFSLAHFHESVQNISDIARFSTEVRTLNIDDVNSARGAPNVDAKSTGDAYEDFFGISDNQSILSLATSR
tara:strand:- start:7390 stop:8274 length:885 start_codon:yes stop_codon:yes gene_type:complete